jgi:hypothetical protein
MHRKVLLCTLSVVSLMFVGGIAGMRPQGAAQDTTPVSEPVWEVLGAATGPSIAPELNMELARFTWMPGYVQAPHTHYGADVVHVLSGEIGWTVKNGDAQVFRATEAGTPGPTEMLSSGSEAVLGPGDAILFDYHDGTLIHYGRTIGNAPAVMVVASLYDPSKPITVWVDENGTPIP